MSSSLVLRQDHLVLDLALRADLVSFVQKAFGTVSPGDHFSPELAHRSDVFRTDQGADRKDQAAHHRHSAAPPQNDRHLSRVARLGSWAMIPPAKSSA